MDGFLCRHHSHELQQPGQDSPKFFYWVCWGLLCCGGVHGWGNMTEGDAPRQLCSLMLRGAWTAKERSSRSRPRRPTWGITASGDTLRWEWCAACTSVHVTISKKPAVIWYSILSAINNRASGVSALVCGPRETAAAMACARHFLLFFSNEPVTAFVIFFTQSWRLPAEIFAGSWL